MNDIDKARLQRAPDLVAWLHEVWRAQHCERERLDGKAVIEHFGRAALRPFLKPVVYDQVVLKS